MQAAFRKSAKVCKGAPCGFVVPICLSFRIENNFISFGFVVSYEHDHLNQQ